MLINFTQVLQDSWNFFRNQKKIMLQFVAILFIVQSASALLSFSVNDENKNDVLNLANTDITSFIFSVAITQILTSFIAAWGLTSIHKISLQNYRTLGETFSLTLRRFAGVILLDLLMVAPMLLGLGEAFAALLTKKSPSIMSLIAMLVGVWFFVRLNLTVVHYLSTQEALSQTIRKIWMQGNTRKGVLFIYTLLVYFLVPILIFQLSAFSNNAIFDMVIGIFTALLNIFMLVVTYRFYSLFIKD
ncbi:TPA: hypothetical protein ACUM2C_001419 [Haemophilus influenzae]|uniref:hypothetical protein n=1 Tax=Haemophilus influenzae TaxID=727 RepID=UPI000C322A17|nr:hypothetical protein [Haemophilus influenzae]MCK9641883.1 hypothetical protein [Haemophilus influenzae]PKF67539.1 hypothetical protein CW355_02970 [Haemophilus influenzae]